MKSYESVPMRRESVFNEGGLYELAVKKNLCLHREAIETGYDIIKTHWAKKRGPSSTVRVLDLACGGKPLIIAEIMGRLPHFSFHYTGIDINRDQIAACKNFSFPKNVQSEVLEGNVWELKELPLVGAYDLVFIGLNTHHAVPEEIVYAAKNIQKLLRPGGLLINHDVFRPARYSYFRRPEKKSMRFVSVEKLQTAGVPTPLSESWRGSSVDWREEWFVPHTAYIQKLGEDRKTAEAIVQHMRERDFPVSMQELAELLEMVGFQSSTHSYQNCSYPAPEFFGMVVGCKSNN